MTDLCLYFAYGSNLCTRRLRERVPSVTFRAAGFVPEHTLRFHKRGRDGSGKCDCQESASTVDCVWGAIFVLDPAERERLDQAEGLGYGYDEKHVVVQTEDGPIRAFCYVAARSYIDASLLPYTWYKDFVVMGAGEHHLPEQYVVMIENVEAQDDPDSTRAATNRRLLPPDL